MFLVKYLPPPPPQQKINGNLHHFHQLLDSIGNLSTTVCNTSACISVTYRSLPFLPLTSPHYAVSLTVPPSPPTSQTPCPSSPPPLVSSVPLCLCLCPAPTATPCTGRRVFRSASTSALPLPPLHVPGAECPALPLPLPCPYRHSMYRAPSVPLCLCLCPAPTATQPPSPLHVPGADSAQTKPTRNWVLSMRAGGGGAVSFGPPGTDDSRSPGRGVRPSRRRSKAGVEVKGLGWKWRWRWLGWDGGCGDGESRTEVSYFNGFR